MFKDLLTKKDIHILLITHDDMDGSGPAILLKALLRGKGEVDVVHTCNDKMNDTIKERCVTNAESTFDKYDFVFITDISCNTETATMIENGDYASRIRLLDHHPTAMALNDFSFATVKNVADKNSVLYAFANDDVTIAACGTSLMHDFLIENFPNHPYISSSIAKFITHLIAGYDTWDWVNVFGKKPIFERLDQLFYIYGKDLFEKKILEKIFDAFSFSDAFTYANNSYTDDREDFFSYEEKEMLKSYKDDADTYCTGKTLQVIERNITIEDRTYSAAFVVAEQYIAELFDALQNKYPEKDIYIVCTFNGISFRTRKDGIDVSLIAKRIGGGGHVQASGAPVTKDIRFAFCDNVLNYICS